MAENVSLLDLVKVGGYDASLITTYAISFPVYEQLLLRKLMSGGCRYNIVLADHQQLAAAWMSKELRPMLAGAAYTLLPVRMGGAFNPKIWFLAGKKKALLLVGSHNLTLAGLGYNKELTSVVELGLQPDDADGLYSDAWRAVKTWVEQCQGSIPRAVCDAVFRFEEFIIPYLRPASDQPQAVIHMQGIGKTSLFEAIQAMAGPDVRRIAVLGPFLDSRFEFLNTLRVRWPAAKIAVGITPEALINDRPLKVPFAHCVDANKLGQSGRLGYVHAKALFLEGMRGEHLLAIGSANPSSPAWLEKGSSRNAEAVMVWKGPIAKAIASDLGLLRLFEEPRLKSEDIELREITAADEPAVDDESTFVGVAAIDQESRTMEIVVGSKHNAVQFSLHGIDDAMLSTGSASGRNLVTIKIPSEITLLSIRSVRLTTSSGVVLSAWVHNSAVIDPLANASVRDQVKKALASLTTDEGNLAEVIDAVQKVIFDDEPEMAVRLKSGAAGGNTKVEREDDSQPETLAVSAASIKRRSTKVRALKSGDLAYLIDVLIRRLAIEREPSAEATDRLGRTEEEQIGKDDEAPPEPAGSVAALTVEDGELAQLICKKVKRLVSRMTSYLLKAAAEPKLAPAAVARLIAVLALLRELRRIESLPRWRMAGLELVPYQARVNLLDSAGEVLLGETHAVLHAFEQMTEDVTEEAGQVRALLTWLAWDIGDEYTEKFSLSMETPDVEWKIYANAALFELLPPVVSDEEDLASLKESISLTNAKTLPAARRQQMWLDRHIALGARWLELKSTPLALLPKKKTYELGDIAVAISGGEQKPRVVALITDSYIGLSTVDNMIRFRRDRVVCLQS